MIYDKITNLTNYSELKKFASGILNAVENIENIKTGANIIDKDVLKANRFSLKCGTSKPLYESHKVYADVHFLIKGNEKIKYLKKDISDKALDEENDARISYDNYDNYEEVELKPGDFCLFLPGEPHCTGNIADESYTDVEKIVFKLKMA